MDHFTNTVLESLEQIEKQIMIWHKVPLEDKQRRHAIHNLLGDQIKLAKILSEASRRVEFYLASKYKPEQNEALMKKWDEFDKAIEGYEVEISNEDSVGPLLSDDVTNKVIQTDILLKDAIMKCSSDDEIKEYIKENFKG